MKKPEAELKRLLKATEAATYLSLSTWSVRKLVIYGKLPYIQLGSRGPWLLDVADLDSFISSQKRSY